MSSPIVAAVRWCVSLNYPYRQAYESLEQARELLKLRV